ncbi:unnamed protein product [Ranitomeya imitator]|uniref:Endonuclease/exonuclease/phosphatase domain-containing protein n=1 Tax=Ranitomeya imitator TaxID=111125 RepID=A0ABN9MPT9_9NEOB|nr:unnamed protein product [Ranitomeya imitator]
METSSSEECSLFTARWNKNRYLETKLSAPCFAPIVIGTRSDRPELFVQKEGEICRAYWGSEFYHNFTYSPTIEGVYVSGANIYLPNQDQVRACRMYLRDLSAFVEGYVIMGGDFNMVSDRAVDFASGRSPVSLSQLERLRRALRDSRAYYDSLYNLSGPLSDMFPSEFQARVDDYIRDTELPPMLVEESEALESPLSEQEVLDTIKSLANGLTWRYRTPAGDVVPPRALCFMFGGPVVPCNPSGTQFSMPFI